MTDWLTTRKRKTDMDAIFTYLCDCVEEEAEVLLTEELRSQGRARSSRKLKNQCLQEAQEHYVEEVSEMISNSWEPSPWAMISYRRKPKVWAIAENIKKQKHKEEYDQ